MPTSPMLKPRYTIMGEKEACFCYMPFSPLKYCPMSGCYLCQHNNSKFCKAPLTQLLEMPGRSSIWTHPQCRGQVRGGGGSQSCDMDASEGASLFRPPLSQTLSRFPGGTKSSVKQQCAVSFFIRDSTLTTKYHIIAQLRIVTNLFMVQVIRQLTGLQLGFLVHKHA